MHYSNIHSALNPDAQNLRLDLLNGEDPPDPVIKSRHDAPDGESQNSQDFQSIEMPQFNPSEIVNPTMPELSTADLIGHSFLKEQENGDTDHLCIVLAIEDHDAALENDKDRIKFLCANSDDTYEEVMSYNQILAHIEKDSEDETLWKFKRISAHEGPLTPGHHNWKGSSFNVMIEWENGEITSEPLSMIAKDDPVTCAIYARENKLLNTPGWKRFKGIAKRQKKLFCMANQAKLHSYCTAPHYKYGFEVPHDYHHALQLDACNGNMKWVDAVLLELAQIDEYDTFKDMGKGAMPEGHKKIRVHLVFDVKHDGRHKARLVADGHLTEVPVDSVYSGVVSLRGL